MTTWSLVGLTLGMVIALEGLPYFAAPRASQRAMLSLAESDPGVLRGVGFLMLVGGLALAWISTR